MANLLLHTCCAPCATYTVEHWRGEGLEVVALWDNPNIHPAGEHQRRQQGLEALARAYGFPLFLHPPQVPRYFAAIRGRADRCAGCFYLRLSRAAQAAREGGYDAFSTSLLLSPYQKHDLLRQVGEAVAREQGIRFLYQDLRSGYPQSRRLSQELGLYRQSYCGCFYSLRERLSRQAGLANPLPSGEGGLLPKPKLTFP